MINNSRDMIPDKILLPKHPFVEDVTAVEEAIEEQEAEEQKKLEEQMKAFGNQGFNQNPAANNANINNPTTQKSGNSNANPNKTTLNQGNEEKKDKKAGSNVNS